MAATAKKIVGMGPIAPLRGTPEEINLFYAVCRRPATRQLTSTLSWWDRLFLQAVRDEWRVIVWRP